MSQKPGWCTLSNLEGEEMEAMTIEEMFWQNEKERRLYELREKAIREELSAIADARAEGKAEAKQEAICKFLKKRFQADASGLQQKVRQINDLEVLDGVLEEIFVAKTLEEAREIINHWLDFSNS